MSDIQGEKKVFIAWTNTNLTDGYGHEYPLAVSESEATVTRLGRKGGVQGSQCRVTASLGYKINNVWYYPGSLKTPTKEDLALDEKRLIRRQAEERARDMGLSEDDISILGLSDE